MNEPAFRCSAHEAAVLKRHPVGGGELQIGDAGLDLGGERAASRRTARGTASPAARSPSRRARGDLGRARRRSGRTLPRRTRRTAPARATRRAMRECPRSDGCLAFDSSSRVFSLSATARGSRRRPPPSQSSEVDHSSSRLPPADDAMHPTTASSPLLRASALQEDLNFLLTNRIPRRLATRFMGWFGKLEQPARPRPLASAIWRLFADLNLDEAVKRSSRACTTASSVSSSPAPARSTPTRRPGEPLRRHRRRVRRQSRACS